MINETSKVVLVEPDRYSQAAREVLDQLGTVEEGPFDRAGLLEAVGDADVLIVRLGHTIDAAVLDRAPRLKAIVSATTGLDHIDMEGAAERKVKVLSLKGETAFLRTIRATVEHTLALALAVIRRLPAAAQHVESGGWDRDPYRGRELAGKRLGIVGHGRIGAAVGRLAQAFEMDVAAFDPYQGPWGSDPIRLDSLGALLAQSDVLSLHVPLTDETRGMIGAPELAALPKGGVLINTSRGAVVDEAALLHALRSGHLGGAGLDVLCDEPALQLGQPHPVVAHAKDHDTVVITPHLGGATIESMERTEVFMANKLAEWWRAR